MLMPYRIGQSTDIHPLVKDRPLILGGVHIESKFGAYGHSDADVLSHVIAEALLGALALGDLGKHFPDTDPKFKGISSLLILKACVEMVKEKKYLIGNIDALILLESPKLAPYMTQIKKSLCAVLEIEEDQLNVKATRGEKLGFVGRSEGIMGQAVVLLVNQHD